MGSHRTVGHRSRVAQGKSGRCLHRNRRPGLWPAPAQGDRRCRGPPDDRHWSQRRVRTGRLHPRPGGSRDDGGHGVLLLAGGPAPGRTVPAPRRVLQRAGRRCHGHGHARYLHQLQPAARARPGRTVQTLLSRRGWLRACRRRRHAVPGAAVRCAPRRPSGAGRRTRYRDQPGWGQQRVVRAERSLAAADDPGGVGERGADRG